MNRVNVFKHVLFALIVSLFAWGQSAHAVVLDVNQHEGYVEYLGLTGVLTGRNAPFRMLVPHDWNGQLIVYARGTGSATKLDIIFDENGQPDVVPQLDPSSGLPIVGVTPLINVPGKPPGDNSVNDELEACWLGLKDCSMEEPRELLTPPEPGFALIASDYKPDPRFIEKGKLGWVVEDGITDTLAVTHQARSILLFWSNHHRLPNRTMLIGRSQGSAIALKINETKPWLYDGVITGCTVGAGTPRVWDVGLGVALAFDAAFGWENKTGGVSWGSPEGGDIPEELSFQVDVAPTLGAYLSDQLFSDRFLIDPTDPTDPTNFVLFEFIRLVNGLPIAGFYPTPDPGNPPTLVFPEGGREFNWLVADMLFLTEVRADLEGPSKANGRVAQNEGHEYTLSKKEKRYLVRLGLDKDTINDMLDEMNDNDVKAEPWARRYAEKYADFTGNLRRPVISMHTWSDGLVIPENESALAVTVADAGKSNKLLQVYTPGFGHCSFTPDQWIANVDAMNAWLDGSSRDTLLEGDFFPPAEVPPPLVPEVGDIWSFPLSTDGFINDIFSPGPWPQPPSD